RSIGVCTRDLHQRARLAGIRAPPLRELVPPSFEGIPYRRISRASHGVGMAQREGRGVGGDLLCGSDQPVACGGDPELHGHPRGRERRADDAPVVSRVEISCRYARGLCVREALDPPFGTLLYGIPMDAAQA